MLEEVGLSHPVRRFWADTWGQDLVEYALMAGLLAMLSVVVVPSVAERMAGLPRHVAALLAQAAGTEAPKQVVSAAGAVEPARSSRADLGTLKSGRGGEYLVQWDQSTRAVYVSYAGSQYAGQAHSRGAALQLAAAWLGDK